MLEGLLEEVLVFYDSGSNGHLIEGQTAELLDLDVLSCETVPIGFIFRKKPNKNIYKKNFPQMVKNGSLKFTSHATFPNGWLIWVSKVHQPCNFSQMVNMGHYCSSWVTDTVPVVSG